jgi:hypothetical protein
MIARMGLTTSDTSSVHVYSHWKRPLAARRIDNVDIASATFATSAFSGTMEENPTFTFSAKPLNAPVS